MQAHIEYLAQILDEGEESSRTIAAHQPLR